MAKKLQGTLVARKATPRQLDWLFEHKELFSEPYLIQRSELRNEWPCFVLLKGKEIIGFQSFEFHDDGKQVHAWVGTTSLKKGFEGKGFGRFLVGRANSLMHARGFSELHVHAYKPSAKRFWLRQHFERVSGAGLSGLGPTRFRLDLSLQHSRKKNICGSSRCAGNCVLIPLVPILYMSSEHAFLQHQFRKYYESARIDSVPEISRREFGIGEYRKKIVKRHLSFSSSGELNAFLQTIAPFYISYSSALYRFPEKSPMDAKEFLGGDLVYEFDAGDMPQAAELMDFFWQCTNCREHGKGSRKACTGCGEKTTVQKWVTPAVLEETKHQVFRLLSLLENELGITEGFSFNFSGNAGYHVHVRSAIVRELSAAARIELADYLSGTGIMPEAHGFFSEGKRIRVPDEHTSVGWGNRILSGIVSLIEQEKAEEMASYGHARLGSVRSLLKNKEAVLREIREQHMLPPLSGGKTEQFWFSLIEYVIAAQGLRLDRQVSLDIRKIIRVPDTIHGSTGLLAQTVSREELKAYTPLKDAVVLPAGESIGVFIDSAPKCSIGGQQFGPYAQASVELPVYAAAYFLGRGAAVLREQS